VIHLNESDAIAIIPARGGSKGIVNKNIINLLEKPLIYYALEACKNSNLIINTVVTTDSDLIAEVVLKKYPETIIIKRPKKISNDTSVSEDAILHSIKELDKQYSNLNKLIFVQATSPLTGSEDLSRLIHMLDKYDSCAFYTEDYGFFFDLDNMNKPRTPRQQRIPRKKEAGNAWAFRKSGFLKMKSRLFGSIGTLKIDHPTELEIDEPSDLLIIESYLKQL
jgi:CMP-N-acetylneuraminic acid synthetase